MRMLTLALITALAAAAGQTPEPQKAVRLADYSWVDAEGLLQADTVVVIPLGAALKEHGPHLPLRNDLTLADYLTDRVAGSAPVVIAPPLTYHFYPAFLEYPGSTSLSLETARDLTVQVIRSLARYGPRRFYVLNTGVSTDVALEPAAAALAAEGILLRFTDLNESLEPLAARVRQQPSGSHADEIETSMMLYIDPSAVDMTRAVKDIPPATTPPRLTRQAGGPGMYSPSGVWGDPTLATPEKGRYLVDGLVAAILADIEGLRGAALPRPRPASSSSSSVSRPARTGSASREGACLPGVEREIKGLEAAFNTHWNNRDAIAFGGLWSDQGDLVHGDGTIERGARTIAVNRMAQFKDKQFRDARHSLVFGVIRCINSSVAVVDGRWELRDVVDANGKVLPRADGLATLVLQHGGSWQIEAYRYNTKPGAPPGPTLLKRPGYPDKD
ncbi:MAG: creatininase family protein [Vicinamibacterales bacterium]